MKTTQIAIFDAQTFTGKKSGEPVYLLQILHFDRFERLKAEGIFTSEKVFKEFSGAGIYDCSFAFGGAISEIHKVSNLTI